jgi:hypothetical protein
VGKIAEAAVRLRTGMSRAVMLSGTETKGDEGQERVFELKYGDQWLS